MAVALAACLTLTGVSRGDSLYAWGDNSQGEYGNGNETNSSTPVPVPGMASGVTAIGGSQGTSMAVKNGAAYAWGANVWGNIGDGSTSPSFELSPYAIPSLATGVTAVSGAYYSSAAIKNGAMFGWGTNSYGSVGDGTTTNRFSPVAAVVLTSGVTAIAYGGTGSADHAFAIKNGAVYAWGNGNSFGDLGTGSSATVTTPVALSNLSSGVTAIAANNNNGAAIKNGALWAWGYNYYGTLGNGNNTEQDTPIPIPSMSSGVTGVALSNLSMIILQNGAVYETGQSLPGGPSQTNTPLLVLPASDSIIAVSAGQGTAYALSSDGSIWEWGSNRYGELGNGNTTDPTTPQQLFAPAGDQFTAISAESIAALALVAPVPEPTSIAIIGVCAAMALRRRRRLEVSNAGSDGIETRLFGVPQNRLFAPTM